MLLSDDQERCSICKYHGHCSLDANGYTPCERIKNMPQCTCTDDELRLDCREHYRMAFEQLQRTSPVWAAYIIIKMRKLRISLYEAIEYVRDEQKTLP